MRSVVQRVRSAGISVADREIAAIGRGLLALVGVEEGDSPADVTYLASKIAGLRIFPEPGPDQDARMRLSVQEAGGSVLVVSQFTLLGDVHRGRRPSFDAAAEPSVALERFDQLVLELRRSGLSVTTGEFGAMMLVSLENDGPVTLILDSRRRL